MSPLETLLIVYIVLLVLNAGVSIGLWTIYRKPIFGQLTGVWGFTLLNFLAQAATLNSPLGSILGFSSYILSAWCLCSILDQVIQRPLSFRPFGVLFGACFILFILANIAGASFTLMALPVAVALAAPQLVWAGRVLTDERAAAHGLVKGFAVVLLVNGLHFLDYPFLRPIPEFAILGYSIVIATSMLFGILLPCIINNFLANQLAEQLRDEIESHKATELDLENALKDAEKASKAKTIFLGNMSHEIRTPINGIVGLNDLLLESPLNAQQKSYALQVKNSGDELLNIVNNILTLAQLESAEVPLQTKQFSLQQLANDLMLYYHQRGTGNCELRLKADSDLQTWVLADEHKIKQVCYNLINNAIKHSHGNLITLGLSFQAYSPRDGEITLSIADNGQGVPRENIVVLTRRFERDEYSATGGVGLGLSIVLEMLSVMDGSFFVDSDLGQGFKAVCVIPALLADCVDPVQPWTAPSDAPAFQEQDPIAPPQTLPKEPFDGPCVLIVEDNPVNQMVIEGMLKKMDIPYRLAVNGEQAMELYFAYQHQWQCILMDVQLPDANGLDLIQRIRKCGDAVNILVLSAFAFSEDEERAMQAGANGYLRKPYHFDHLKAALKKFDEIC